MSRFESQQKFGSAAYEGLHTGPGIYAVRTPHLLRVLRGPAVIFFVIKKYLYSLLTFYNRLASRL